MSISMPSFSHVLRVIALSAALVGALIAGGAPALAQDPCSPTNGTNWCVHEDLFGVIGLADDDGHFGGALAFGDFNGDGFDDLAVGTPGTNDGAGIIHVFYSNGSVLALLGQQGFGQANAGGAADGGPEVGDQFGAALAAGDFDQDGFDDLAVGSPGETLLETSPADCSGVICEESGGVHVIYGSAAGLDIDGSQFFNAGDLTGAFGDGPQDGEHLGETLVVGDFSGTGDGIDDLAVGAPDRFLAAPGKRGVIYVAFGSADGMGGGEGGLVLGTTGIEPPCAPTFRRLGAALAVARFEPESSRELIAGAPLCQLGSTFDTGAVFSYGPPTILSSPTLHLEQADYGSAINQPGDAFGTTLAVADFNVDGVDDLAVGAPLKNHGSGTPSDSGVVYVAYGTASGPDPSVAPDEIGEEEWAGQTPEAGDGFGTALAAGFLNRDLSADLLIGNPGQGSDGGFVYVKNGSALGLTTAGNQVISQGFIGGATESGDRFGEVLALGDVNGDGVAEVAIGVPHEDIGTIIDAGMVYVTHFFDTAWILSDGFETGDKSAWSASTP